LKLIRIKENGLNLIWFWDSMQDCMLGKFWVWEDNAIVFFLSGLCEQDEYDELTEKNLVLAVYHKTMLLLWSDGEKATFPWWEATSLSQAKSHLEIISEENLCWALPLYILHSHFLQVVFITVTMSSLRKPKELTNNNKEV
jgi:hypothetical protein